MRVGAVLDSELKLLVTVWTVTRAPANCAPPNSMSNGLENLQKVRDFEIDLWKLGKLPKIQGICLRIQGIMMHEIHF